jgi:hypothetical protein
MSTHHAFLFAALAAFASAAAAQDAAPDAAEAQSRREAASSRVGSWTKSLADRSERDKLSDQSLAVRGDSGKWSDAPQLQLAPPLERKPPKTPLDEWLDQLAEQDVQLAAGDDAWLLFRTRQLDDHDRVWVSRIERRGARFTITAQQAVWQGRYQKNFTYHQVLGVNLGKLTPGEYEAVWILEPWEFSRFEPPGTPRDNWPQDEHAMQEKPITLRATFTVAKAP